MKIKRFSIVGYNPKLHDKGIVTLEFAITAVAFFLTLLLLIDIGSLMFRYVSLSEVARKGGRLASACDLNDRADVLSKMQTLVPSLTDANVKLDYLKSDGTTACTSSADCLIVKVSFISLTYDINTPAGPYSINLPDFSTSIIRESMDSSKNSQC